VRVEYAVLSAALHAAHPGSHPVHCS
jgi:hypothetical protein